MMHTVFNENLLNRSIIKWNVLPNIMRSLEIIMIAEYVNLFYWTQNITINVNQ